MGTVTYPEAAAAARLSERFVRCQINTQDGSSAVVVQQYRHLWTPDLRILDSDGFELYRWNGNLPPFEFLAQLLVAQGHSLLRLQKEAEAIFEDVVNRLPNSDVALEAQYFSAVAKNESTHEGNDLLKGWHQLRSRYPSSTWRCASRSQRTGQVTDPYEER